MSVQATMSAENARKPAPIPTPVVAKRVRFSLVQMNGGVFEVIAPGDDLEGLRLKTAVEHSKQLHKKAVEEGGLGEEESVPACLIAICDMDTFEPLEVLPDPEGRTDFRVVVVGSSKFCTGDTGGDFETLLGLAEKEKPGWFFYHPVADFDLAIFSGHMVEKQREEWRLAKDRRAEDGAAAEGAGQARANKELGAAPKGWRAGLFWKELESGQVRNHALQKHLREIGRSLCRTGWPASSLPKIRATEIRFNIRLIDSDGLLMHPFTDLISVHSIGCRSRDLYR